MRHECECVLCRPVAFLVGEDRHEMDIVWCADMEVPV